jgi:hypothetical protein
VHRKSLLASKPAEAGHPSRKIAGGKSFGPKKKEWQIKAAEGELSVGDGKEDHLVASRTQTSGKSAHRIQMPWNGRR